MDPATDETIIAVMGATGSGKSSFISLTTGSDRVDVGHSLTSETRNVSPYPYDYRGRRFVLVDTPGFDDTHLSDQDVFRTLSEWLASSYRAGTKISGILYLHRISDPRMQGSALRNLAVFKSLCGEECFSNVLLCTTFWSLFNRDPSIAEAREKELTSKEEFWGGMIRRGSEVCRLPSDQSGARRMLYSMTSNIPVALQIQREIVDDGKKLDDTTAAASFWEQELMRMNEEHERERQAERQKFAQQMRETEEREGRAREALRQDYEEKLRKQQEANTDWEHEQRRRDDEYQKRQELIQHEVERMRLQRQDIEESMAEAKFQRQASERHQKRTQFLREVASTLEIIELGKSKGRIKCDLNQAKTDPSLICDNCFKSIEHHERYNCALCNNGEFNLCTSCFGTRGTTCNDSKHNKTSMSLILSTGGATSCPRVKVPPQGLLPCNECKQNIGICYLHCCKCDESYDICVDCAVKGARCKGHRRAFSKTAHRLNIGFRYLGNNEDTKALSENSEEEQISSPKSQAGQEDSLKSSALHTKSSPSPPQSLPSPTPLSDLQFGKRNTKPIEDTIVQSRQSLETPKSTDQTSLDPKKSKTSSVLISALEVNYLYLEFDELQLEPQAKPACDNCVARGHDNIPGELSARKLFICADCDRRRICEPCAKQAISAESDDTHEADHYLSEIISIFEFPLEKFVAESKLRTISIGQRDKDYGLEWLGSDHSFTTAGPTQTIVSFRFSIPPGGYNVGLRLRTALVSSNMDRAKREKFRLRASRGSNLGSLNVTVEATERSSRNSIAEPSIGQHLRKESIEADVKEDEDRVKILRPGRLVTVEEGQILEIQIKHCYDGSNFKNGSPFKWWLDDISLSQEGMPDHVASMEELERCQKKRLLQKQQQKKQQMDKILEASQKILTLGIEGTKPKPESERKESLPNDAKPNPNPRTHSLPSNFTWSKLYKGKDKRSSREIIADPLPDMDQPTVFDSMDTLDEILDRSDSLDIASVWTN